MQMCNNDNLGALMNVNIYCGSSASRHFTKNRKFSRKTFLKTKVKSRFVYLLFTVCVLSFHYFLSTFILWPYDLCACVFVRLYQLRSCPIANVSSPISQTLHRLARYMNNSLLVDIVGLLHNYTTDLDLHTTAFPLHTQSTQESGEASPALQ